MLGNDCWDSFATLCFSAPAGDCELGWMVTKKAPSLKEEGEGGQRSTDPSARTPSMRRLPTPQDFEKGFEFDC